MRGSWLDSAPHPNQTLVELEDILLQLEKVQTAYYADLKNGDEQTSATVTEVRSALLSTHRPGACLLRRGSAVHVRLSMSTCCISSGGQPTPHNLADSRPIWVRQLVRPSEATAAHGDDG